MQPVTSSGDALLYAASAALDMSWDAFKRAVDSVCTPDGRFASDMRLVRAEAASVGDALAHWDVVADGGDRRVVVAPPVLARLPWPGLPRSALCGSRSPDTLTEIRDAARGLSGVDVRSTTQRHPYAAARIEIEASTPALLDLLADRLGIEYRDQPPAWSLVQACPSVREYLAALEWLERPDLNWDRRDFDTARLAFVPGDPAADGLRLSSYAHPGGWEWREWLWDGARSADADRDWGRYVLLMDAGVQVLQYEPVAGTVTVPLQVPLPKMLARALVLCSGSAPSYGAGQGLGTRVHAGVPQPIAEVALAKVGQDVPVTTTDGGSRP